MASDAAQAGSVDYTKAIIIGACAIAAALAISIVGLGVGLAMGGATGSAAQSISRNPDASGKIMLAMIVGMAMTESIAIYALVISLLILYANPMLKYVFA
ncbi:MAG: ATP synthase F0 subunit C [Deltaproteobacteria bacterium]|nr:ATP synthase F0 subunit C [Deltaproteobacteria bacterium]